MPKAVMHLDIRADARKQLRIEFPLDDIGIRNGGKTKKRASEFSNLTANEKTNILLKSVPWCAVMMVSSFGSYPTYPIQIHIRDSVPEDEIGRRTELNHGPVTT
jgi:hypothetical protein